MLRLRIHFKMEPLCFGIIPSRRSPCTKWGKCPFICISSWWKPSRMVFQLQSQRNSFRCGLTLSSEPWPSRGCLGDYVKQIKNWSGTIIFPRSIKHSIEFVTLSLPLGAWHRQQNGNNNADEFEWKLLVSKETVVLRRWESEHENSVLSNELIKGRITTMIDLESWRSKRLVQKCVTNRIYWLNLQFND